MKDKNLLVIIDDDSEEHEIFTIALGEIPGAFKCLFFLLASRQSNILKNRTWMHLVMHL